MSKSKLFIFLFFLIFLLSPQKASALSCKAARPATPPTLISATPGNGSVTLRWEEAGDPLTYYLIAYGKADNSFEYGIPDVGGRGTTSFTIDHLENGTKYYFKVRGGNGCKPGEFSNKLSAIPGTDPEKIDLPALSIFKRTEDVSKSALFNKKIERKVLGATSEVKKDRCSKNCNGVIFLGIETTLLILYFYISKKIHFIKPVFSIVIPAALFLIFTISSQSCSLSPICRSFLPLSLLIYVLMLVYHKKIFIYKSR